jgi:starch phosphorylase
MKQTIFSDFDRITPAKIVNITNGITPRRWLNQANPPLRDLITAHIGNGWIKDLSRLQALAPLAADPEFRARFRAVKREMKSRLAAAIHERLGTEVAPASLFDVQVKRFHEYKRQLLNLLHVITRYNRIRDGHTAGLVPRTVIFSGKAAPGYAMAKLIIKLVHAVADVVNNDPAASGLLKVVFVPDYSVSNAELIIPASDLSEQISTAGTEASGTGNMKLALNGAITIGTLDGANIEIRQQVGPEQIFIFGLTAEQAADLRARGYDPAAVAAANPDLRRILDMIGSGFFSVDVPDRFTPITDALTKYGDHFLLLADYASYIASQDAVDALYVDEEEWSRRAILNVAGMGYFSSDRTIREYAEHVWGVTAVRS